MLGLIGAHEFFFHLIFPYANRFFVLRPPPPTPPHKFSNGLSLIRRDFDLSVFLFQSAMISAGLARVPVLLAPFAFLGVQIKP